MKEDIYRIERDSLGEVQVLKEANWGPQTQRSLNHFKIGKDRMPLEVIYALVEIKRACAKVNFKYKKIEEEKKESILSACDRILKGKMEEEFPLSVWQTGSGTQSNMNVNEVISNLCEGSVHPNDDVNASQSSNDTFPTAMHLAALKAVREKLFPVIERSIAQFKKIEEANRGMIKIGRTHLQDAVPLYFSDEVSGWRRMLEESKEQIKLSLTSLEKLAIGGTAVGTGLNAPEGFGGKVAEELSERYGMNLSSSSNKFHSLSSKDAFVFSHGAVKALAANLLKIANDIRFMASGPRCGYGELEIPVNEPGSSIMPGKVNPTQAEALTMVCVEVMGNDTAIGIAASQGNFELNVYMPLIIFNYLRSVNLLAEALESFTVHCLEGLKAKERMEEYVEESLMLVTALSKELGYEKAAQIAKKAYEKDKSLKEVAMEIESFSEEEIDRMLDPKNMVRSKNEKKF